MKPLPALRSVWKNAGFLLGGHVLTTVFRISLVLVLARALGPESYGHFNYGLAWYLLLIPLTQLGLDTYLAQRIGADRANAGLHLSLTLRTRLCAAVVLAGCSYVLAWVIEGDAQLRALIGIFSIGLVGRTLWLWAASAFVAFEDARFALRYEAAFRPLEVALMLGIVSYTQDIHLLAAVHSALWWLQGLLALFTVKRRCGPILTEVSVHGSLRILRQTAPAGAYIMVITAFMQAPIVVVSLAADDPVLVGQFALAYQAFGYAAIALLLFSSALLPVLAKSASGNGEAGTAFLSPLVRVTLIGGVAAVILAGPAVPPMMTLVFGDQYAVAGQLLRMALWLLIPLSAVAFLSQALFARSMYAPAGLYAMLGLTVSAAAIVPASFANPGEGALLALGAGLCAWYLVITLNMERHAGPFDRRGLLRAFLSAGIGFAFFAFLGDYGAWFQAASGIAGLLFAVVFLRPLQPGDLRILMRGPDEP